MGKIWLDGHCAWRPVTSWVQRFILRLFLCNISINDLKVATLIKFADDIKVGVGERDGVNMFEKKAAIQRDLDRLEEWADSN